MRISARVRAISAAFAVIAGSLTFTAVGAGTAGASGCPSNGQVLGPIQTISAGGRSIGQFYLGWNCNGAYTEVNLWNTNYINNWRNGQVDVQSSSDFKVGPSAPVYNNGTYWFDAGYIPVYVSNTRLYHGNWNFTAYGHSCSGETPTWNFSNGSYDSSNAFSHCN